MSLFRTLLLWAVMLAVPLQGYAAASMQFCAAGEASAVAVAMSQPAAPHDHAHDSQHGVSTSDLESTPHHHDHASGGGDSTHKCGTCGACHSVALIGTAPVLMAAALPPAALAEQFYAVASLTPRVLDKPPRS